MREALRLMSPPGSEPVTLQQAKNHLRLETAADDDYISTLIQVAREKVEADTWRGIILQTWELALDTFPWCEGCALNLQWHDGRTCPGREIRLPKGQVQGVFWVKYDDAAGNEQIFDPSKWLVDGFPPARIVLKANEFWPILDGYYYPNIKSVRVQYQVGYGEPDTVPAGLKQAMLLLISQFYEHRTPEVIGPLVSPVQLSYDALIRPYRLNEVT